MLLFFASVWRGGFRAFVVIDDLPSLGSVSVGAIHSEVMNWNLIHQPLVVSLLVVILLLSRSLAARADT